MNYNKTKQIKTFSAEKVDRVTDTYKYHGYSRYYSLVKSESWPTLAKISKWVFKGTAEWESFFKKHNCKDSNFKLPKQYFVIKRRNFERL